MILGFGHDLVDIRRIEQCLTQFGARFEARVFTHGEQALARSRANTAATYAKRFAAKEACLKALKNTKGISWKELEVTHDENGAPTMVLHGAAAARLSAMTPSGMRARLHLSLTDEFPYASAQVIISAEAL